MTLQFSVSGERDEVCALFTKLFIDAVPVLGDESIVSDSWTVEEMGELWLALTEGAQEVLMAIAEHKGYISNVALQEALGLDNGFQIAGRMSSFGSAIKRLRFLEKEPVYTNDYSKGVKIMKPHIVEMILRLVAETR